jgi:hypothetical protein
MILRTACFFKTAEQNLRRDRHGQRFPDKREVEHGMAQPGCYFWSFFTATSLKKTTSSSPWFCKPM